MRNILATITGLATAFVTFMIVEQINFSMHKPATELNMTDPVAMKNYIAGLPMSALVILLFGYALGSFLCGVVIKLITKTDDKIRPLIAGIFLTAGGILNLNMIPHPLWFVVINVLLYIPFVLLGSMVAGRKYSS